MNLTVGVEDETIIANRAAVVELRFRKLVQGLKSYGHAKLM